MTDYSYGSESESSLPSESPATSRSSSISPVAVRYSRQAGKPSLLSPYGHGDGSKTAVQANFITPPAPILMTAHGSRLPGVPLAEAGKLNTLKAEINGGSGVMSIPMKELQTTVADKDSRQVPQQHRSTIRRSGEGSLRRAIPPSRTNLLFPPLPLYGPSSFGRDIKCLMLRTSSFVLSLTFLVIVMLGSVFTSIPLMFNYIWFRLTLRDPGQRRPFFGEEKRRAAIRKEEEKCWKKEKSRQRTSNTMTSDDKEEEAALGEFIPTEGGQDPIVCDVGYYARRVGLDMEEFKVQTEDGFIIRLWHIYNPREYTPMTATQRAARGPNVFTDQGPSRPLDTSRKPKYPILMVHGLLQSAGAYCVNDDCSLAFYLCKSGYDVWLGNNRCGFTPEHTSLSYSDPRMWAWNIRQMGVLDLPALTSRVLSETGFEKLGLIAHSQGTTQTFVALAKEQRPELGDKLSVFCALAPAAYAGPLIGKAYFKFMRLVSPAVFRIIFGIHAFIPFMMTMHSIIPGYLYGALGYRVFSFLFEWTDDRWDRGLRARMFQFAPVYVSAESMRWWLGREGFATRKCILSTREEGHEEDREDEMEDYYQNVANKTPPLHHNKPSDLRSKTAQKKHERKPKGSTAWYDKHVPPFALWVAGSDELVDGNRLLRRFERGREPNVRVVHSRVIQEYEHLDVIWAMDCIEKVGKELKETLWKTCNAREKCRVPIGCEEVRAWVDERRGRGRGVENGGDGVSESSGQSSSAEDR